MQTDQTLILKPPFDDSSKLTEILNIAENKARAAIAKARGRP